MRRAEGSRRLRAIVGATASTALAAVLLGLLAASPAGAEPSAPGTQDAPVATDSPTATATATDSPTSTPTSTPTATPTSTPTGTATPLTGSPGTAMPSSTTTAPALPPAPKSDDEGPLTQAQVQAQLAQAAALAAQRTAIDAGLQAALEQLQAIGLKVSAALDTLAQARIAQSQAQQVQQINAQLLTRARGEMTVQRDALGQWARDTYATGGPMGAYEGWLLALQADSGADVAHNLAVLEEIGISSSLQLQRLQSSVDVQAEATRQAALASAQAAAAKARAAKAVIDLKGLMDQARLAAAQLQVQQARLTGAASLTAKQRANLTAAEAVVASLGGKVVPKGQCQGLSTLSYPNGTIPAAALCPVWGAPGKLLRADAAAGFAKLSKAFGAEFSRPLCVTDTYRTLAEQIQVFATKPGLAARPGTSNHGWGTAADLCGGIESFGTAEHAWMLAHAPLYGWFHPSWAGPAGSRPEPWHWEFAG
ncbi:M15 family metallopeptidase [Angustibacter sp. McL0619]|uniref:M15 family metallopeptidase n=1 Tax=Angustibacter sp. McL0619 TaxID=3415676 RepID=UPI003CFACC05